MDKLTDQVIGGTLTISLAIAEGVVVSNITGIDGYCSTPFLTIVRCNIVWLVLFISVLLFSTILVLVIRMALKNRKEFHLPQKPFNIFCKVFTKGNEVYIEVKNGEWFFDAIKVFARCDFLYKSEVVQDHIKWLVKPASNGESLIFRRKKKVLHFATVNRKKNEFYVHLLQREYVFPIDADGGCDFRIFSGGISSAPSTKLSKHILNRRVSIVQSLKNGEVVFKICGQW